MGTRPNAKEMARTRSSAEVGIRVWHPECRCRRKHTNVSLGRAHGGWGDSKDLLNSLTSEGELSNNLLVGEGGKESVRPGVDADFVAGHVLFDQDSWSLNHARANNKEGSLDVLLVEVFEQFSRGAPSQMSEMWYVENREHTPCKVQDHRRN